MEELPAMFIWKNFVGEGEEREETFNGGTTFVVLRDDGDEVIIGEFGLNAEAGHIKHKDDDWVFEAVDEEDISKPPFRRVFSTDREEVVEWLESDKFFYGEAVREAWENWSEGGRMRLKISGDDREFDVGHSLLTSYNRSDRY